MPEIVLVADPTSWPELRGRAEELSRVLFPNDGNALHPFPIEEVIEHELSRFNCELDVVDAIADGIEACVDWDDMNGMFRMVLPDDLYQAMYDGDGRARFTAAHELSHLVLHAEKIRKAAGAVVPSGLFRRSHEVPAYMNAERQANVFAGSLLLPEEVVLSAVKTHGSNAGILAEMFQVSHKAMVVRLEELRGRW